MSDCSTLRQSVNAVLFDMDDTLISRRGAFRRYCDGFYGRQEALHATPSEEAIQTLVEWDGRGDNNKHEFFSKVKSKWPGVTDSIPDLIEDFWWRLADAVEPDPQALAFLEELNAKSVPWGIVTNGPQFQYTKIKNAQLDELHPFAIVGGVFGADKPDPRIFQEALRRLSNPAEHTLFVGDNPRTDIRGAQAVGLKTAWVRAGRSDWSWGDPEPDCQIDHVVQLRSILVNQ